MRYTLLCLLAVMLSAVSLSRLPAADWPGWRGPDRTGVSNETGLLSTWPEAGPKLLWTSDKAGLGFAGIAAVDDVVYTMGARGDEEYVLAFDAKGKEKWATKIGPVHDFRGNSWSHGPNATPTVDGDLVFALASKGDLICVKKADGAKVWSINVPKELSGEVNPIGGGVPKFGWGYSWSPLADGDQLILTPGGPKGLFAAVDKKTGKVLWRSTDVTDQATYSSPVVATIGGVKQLIYLTQSGVVGVAASDGGLLWTWKRARKYRDVVAPTPIVKKNLVYVSEGYGDGSALLKITPAGKKFSAAVVYTEKVIGNKQGGVVLVETELFGFHEDSHWVCQDFTTGKVIWPKRRPGRAFKAGGLLAADGKLFTLDEGGTVTLLEASPKGYKPLGSFNLPKESEKRKSNGKVWTHPSLSNGKLYLRDQEFVFCYQVK